MNQTIRDVLAAVYLAGTENGLGRRLKDVEEIMHRKEAFIKVNPACLESLAQIKKIIEEEVLNAEPCKDSDCKVHKRVTDKILANLNKVMGE